MSIFCSIMRFIGVFGLVVGIAGCDLSTPTHVGDNSKIPSNLHPVSFSSLPDWEKDNVLYALQAFRNTCSAKMQHEAKFAAWKADKQKGLEAFEAKKAAEKKAADAARLDAEKKANEEIAKKVADKKAAEAAAKAEAEAAANAEAEAETAQATEGETTETPAEA